MLSLLRVSVTKGVVLATDLAEEKVVVLGSGSQIRQVVLNLVINASEALGNNSGSITVKTRPLFLGPDSVQAVAEELPPGEYVQLEVIDSGPGMTPEVRKRIFDPFYTTKFAGRGLGLAMVHTIIREHRGAIRLSSSPGAGTCFGILLPVAPAAGPYRTARAFASPDSCPTATIMVVEDEEILRMAVCKMLRKKGYRVIEAGDGLAAAQVFRGKASEIDVVVVDLTVPGSPGRSLFEDIRSIWPAAKVILTSAYDEERARDIVDGPETLEFLRKPYWFDDLLCRIQNMLSSGASSRGIPLGENTATPSPRPGAH
jgi:CheY-like chemotaxis protein